MLYPHSPKCRINFPVKKLTYQMNRISHLKAESTGAKV